ncbi:MAG: hypothetical protein ACTHJS_07145 [Xanthobacteraceae bacterium]
MTGCWALLDGAKKGSLHCFPASVAWFVYRPIPRRATRCGFDKEENKMRIMAFAIAAAFALGIPASVPAKAEDTTVIKKHRDYDNDRAKIIIKKKEEPRDKKVIIHKDE